MQILVKTECDTCHGTGIFLQTPCSDCAATGETERWVRLPEFIRLAEQEKLRRLFTCKGCGHQLDEKFIMKTPGYCYLCDPAVTLEECLSDKPITNQQPEGGAGA